MRYVLLHLHNRGEMTKHMTIWAWPRWKDWRERNKHRYEDVDAKFVVKVGTKKQMQELRRAFDSLTKEDKNEE